MLRAHTVADVRAAEEVLLRAETADGTLPPSGATSRLMMRAATGLAARCVRALRDRRGSVAGGRVAVLIGPGDNGGDAAHAGALLARRGVAVHGVALSGAIHRDGAHALRLAGGALTQLVDAPEAPLGQLLAADLIIDGLLGIGAHGGLREPAATTVRRLRAALGQADHPPIVVAADLPSGVGPDDGAVPGPVLPADITVTFGTHKPAHLLPPAALLAGEVYEVGLGLQLPGAAVRRLETEDIAALWPQPGPADHKYTRGVLGVVAGSPSYTGAAALCVQAATLSGVGMVRLYSAGAADLVRARCPEIVTNPGRVQCWAIGSGLDPEDPTLTATARDALSSGQPCVVDAGGLSVAPELVGDAAPRPWILTPHAGELATMLRALGEDVDRADVEADPRGHACRAAQRTGAVVALKGAVTVIAVADGPVFTQAESPSWLATAGAGDVLTGIMGALLAGLAARSEAQAGGGLSPDTLAMAAAAAVSIHGRAATRACDATGGPITAGQVAAATGAAIGELLRHGEPLHRRAQRWDDGQS